MNKKPIVQAIFVFALSAACEARAQYGALDEVGLKKAVEAGNYAELLGIADSYCSTIKDATYRQITVEQRLEAATEARRCAQEYRGALLATSSFEQRAGIDALMDPYIEQRTEAEAIARAEDEFLGLNWGVGVGYSFSFDDAIDEATIADGVVRVTSSKENEPRLLLEFHKYFWCNDQGRDGTKGCGPFVAVSAKDDDVLAGVGIGLMYGRKVKASDSDGFSVGIGAILDGDVKNMGDGFEENQPPPGSETVVRFESKSRWSAVLFVTRTF